MVDAGLEVAVLQLNGREQTIGRALIDAINDHEVRHGRLDARVDLIAKPFTESNLAEMVRRVLARAEIVEPESG